MFCANEAISEWLGWETKLHNHNLYFSDRGQAFKNIQIDFQYRSESGQIWPIPYIVVPVSECSNFILQPIDLSAAACSIMYTDEKKSCYRFFVHPFAQEIIRARLMPYMEFVSAENSEFMASPTSSLRSLVVWNRNKASDPLMVKVSVFAVAHGQMRFVDWDAAGFHYSRGQWLRIIKESSLNPLGLELMDESAYFGLPLTEPLSFEADTVITGQNNVARFLCNIVREFPQEVLSGNKKFLGCTSYMSPERKPKTFIETIASSTNQTVLDSINEILVVPALHCLEQLAKRHGVTLEPHPQNLLIQLDDQYVPTGKLVFRDFGAVWLEPLKAFDQAPELIMSLMACNGGRPMEPFEANYSRFNVVRSVGTNFVHATAYRALAVLVLKRVITDSQAADFASSVKRRVADFFTEYFGHSLRCDPLQAHKANRTELSEDLAPRLSQLKNLGKLKQKAASKEQNSSGMIPICYFDHDYARHDLDWYEHQNGLVGAIGQRVVVLWSQPATRWAPPP